MAKCIRGEPMAKCIRCKNEIPNGVIPRFFIIHDLHPELEDGSGSDDVEYIGELCQGCGEFCRNRQYDLDQEDQEKEEKKIFKPGGGE